MKFSMIGLEKCVLFKTGDYLVEMTAWAGLNVYD